VSLPPVLVLPDRYVNSLKADPPPNDLDVFRLLPAREALETEWETDAHLAMYGADGEDALPRLSSGSGRTV